MLNIMAVFHAADLADRSNVLPLSDLKDDKVVSFPLIWFNNQVFIDLSVGTPP